MYLVLLSALMFGSYGLWSRLMGGYFEPFFQGWTRGLIILLLITPYLWWRQEIVPIDKQDWKWFASYMCFTSLTQAPLYYAYNHMDIGTATVLFFATMLLTMYFFGFGLYGEKLSRVKVVAFVLACLGLYVTFSFSLAVFSVFAALMAVLNGVASGGEISSSKMLTGKYSALYVTWLSWIMVLITNLPVSILLGEVWHSPGLNLPWLFQAGYVGVSIVGFWAVIEGFKYVEASIGGLLGLSEVVFGILLGVLIFQESLTTRAVVGAMLVIIAAALPHLVTIRQRLISSFGRIS